MLIDSLVSSRLVSAITSFCCLPPSGSTGRCRTNDLLEEHAADAAEMTKGAGMEEFYEKMGGVLLPGSSLRNDGTDCSGDT